MDEGEGPGQAFARELLEEVGCRAEVVAEMESKWDLLMKLLDS